MIQHSKIDPVQTEAPRDQWMLSEVESEEKPRAERRTTEGTPDLRALYKPVK